MVKPLLVTPFSVSLTRLGNVARTIALLGSPSTNMLTVYSYPVDIMETHRHTISFMNHNHRKLHIYFIDGNLSRSPRKLRDHLKRQQISLAGPRGGTAVRPREFSYFLTGLAPAERKDSLLFLNNVSLAIYFPSYNSKLRKVS